MSLSLDWSHVFLESGGVEVVVWLAGNGIADGLGEALHGLVHISVGLNGGVHCGQLRRVLGLVVTAFW